MDRYEGTHYAEGAEAMLLFRLDAGGEASLKMAEQILNDDHAKNIKVTSDPKEAAAIIKLRQDMLPAVFANGQHIMEDMAVPVGSSAEMMDYICVSRTGLKCRNLHGRSCGRW